MGSIENFKINLRRLMDQKGIKPTPLSRKISNHGTVVRYILNGRVAQPRLETRQKIADALGVSLEELESDPNDAVKVDTSKVRLADGSVAQVQDPEEFKAQGWQGIDLLVTLRLANETPQLATLSRIGDMMVLFQTETDGTKHAAIPYQPKDAWYNGEVVLEGQTRTARISGVVRFLTIPCNSGIGDE